MNFKRTKYFCMASLTVAFLAGNVHAGNVTVYEHADFQGAQQSFGPGSYRADQGQIMNDLISSVKVPFGMGADLFEHENNGNGDGEKMYLGPGEHKYIGNNMNDKTSLLKVYNNSSLYMSSDQFNNLPVTHHGGGDYDIPNGCNLNVWEATKSGQAGWSHNIENGKLKIRLWVQGTGPFQARNWVGVNFACQ